MQSSIMKRMKGNENLKLTTVLVPGKQKSRTVKLLYYYHRAENVLAKNPLKKVFFLSTIL